MKRWVTSNGTIIYRVLNGRSNAYLVCAGSTAVLVDRGTALSDSRLRRHIETARCGGSLLKYLLLTHSHFDHCQNTAKIQMRKRCQVLLSVRDHEYAMCGYTPIPAGSRGGGRAGSAAATVQDTSQNTMNKATRGSCMPGYLSVHIPEAGGWLLSGPDARREAICGVS